MDYQKKKLLLVLIVLFLAGVAPNLFPISQTGTQPLSSLANDYLLPSLVLIFLITVLNYFLKFKKLNQQIYNGMLAGLVATIGLEIVREIGFRLGGMPGDLPKLMGVLLLDRFAEGPGVWSNIAGWAYHFWNGACFGIIFSLLFGGPKIWAGIAYGFFIGIGFMMSPVTRTLGIGAFGFQFKDGYQFITTVTLAHIAFGSILGWMIYKMNMGKPNILKRLKSSFDQRLNKILQNQTAKKNRRNFVC